jgi:FdhD protein
MRLSITTRTPGHDLERAHGVLYTEGLIDALTDLVHVAHCENVKGKKRDAHRTVDRGQSGAVDVTAHIPYDQ